MSSKEILFDVEGLAITPAQISERVVEFGDSYNDATQEIIYASKILDKDGEVFIKCASRILSNFGMTRSGPFRVNGNET